MLYIQCTRKYMQNVCACWSENRFPAKRNRRRPRDSASGRLIVKKKIVFIIFSFFTHTRLFFRPPPPFLAKSFVRQALSHTDGTRGMKWKHLKHGVERLEKSSNLNDEETHEKRSREIIEGTKGENGRGSDSSSWTRRRVQECRTQPYDKSSAHPILGIW